MSEKAIWLDDGQPQNLAAAAEDALPWLKIFQTLNRQKRNLLLDAENTKRLKLAIESLESFVSASLEIGGRRC